MASREFKLPGVQDLSKEQEAARALPKEGQHLIVGGPGTGKSVLALLRSRRHRQDGDDYVFLVYNHLLHRASGQLFGAALESSTWIAWFRQTYWEVLRQRVPLLPPQPNRYRAEDWDAMGKTEIARDAGRAAPRPHLVIDEGQDMPPQFYETLIRMGFQNFFVVADQNQQIIEKANSNRKELEDELGIDTKDVIELDLNYRNRYAVARLAREFYTGDPASPPPSLPEGTSERRSVPVLYTYRQTDLATAAANILRHADSEPRRLIGVITPKDVVRERYLKALQDSDVSLDNAKPNIETFYGQHRPDVTFREGGILVINAQSCKGLEFDTAILADIDEHYYSPVDPDATKRMFYVMVARAIDRVFLFKKAGRARIDEILPDDPNIMRRQEL